MSSRVQNVVRSYDQRKRTRIDRLRHHGSPMLLDIDFGDNAGSARNDTGRKEDIEFPSSRWYDQGGSPRTFYEDCRSSIENRDRHDGHYPRGEQGPSRQGNGGGRHHAPTEYKHHRRSDDNLVPYDGTWFAESTRPSNSTHAHWHPPHSRGHRYHPSQHSEAERAAPRTGARATEPMTIPSAQERSSAHDKYPNGPRPSGTLGWDYKQPVVLPEQWRVPPSSQKDDSPSSQSLHRDATTQTESPDSASPTATGHDQHGGSSVAAPEAGAMAGDLPRRLAYSSGLDPDRLMTMSVSAARRLALVAALALLAPAGARRPALASRAERAAERPPAPPSSRLPRLGLARRLWGERRRGAAPSSADAADVAPPTRASEWSLRAAAFLLILSLGVVSLAPAPALIARLGTEPAMTRLQWLSATSAVTEIGLTPLVGALVDDVGRKPILMLTLLSVALINGAVAASPVTPLVCASKFWNALVIGLFFLTAQATLADMYRAHPRALAAASGVIFALVNGGFAAGVQLSAALPKGLHAPYAVSALAAACALLIVSRGTLETMPPSERKVFRARKALASPLSCLLLFRTSPKLSALSALVVLQLLPLFMGDVLQVHALEVWSLRPTEVVFFFSILGASGVLANTAGGHLVRRLGIRGFTVIATVSHLLFWAGMCTSHRAAVALSVVGALGAARSLGVSTLITAEGTRAGRPQGELSGARANLIAVLKVIGPVLYSQLFVRGRALGAAQLPFTFNVALMVAALALAHTVLSDESGAAGGAAEGGALAAMGMAPGGEGGGDAKAAARRRRAEPRSRAVRAASAHATAARAP